MEFVAQPIGIIRSPLKDRSECPHQGNEGAPEAWVELEPEYTQGLDGFEAGQEIVILSWMHLADRSVLRVHPRGDQSKPLTGVFRTRSADRPNPIGLHRVTIVAFEPPSRLLVRPLEAIDKTPVLDIKCVLDDGT
ncbi:MAG TPA: tRNA (N6-threonylcarbamoyladenosine(37)-N6)-methyltransferase TrmO [Desulfomonilaceae bacterium]|nr:tRNA (N6-threonylcarbamoyladenosine(37)-N6)-methyltransferase TrmO [Desulfomonilaceae bacterium]